ncbi:hypothetical protein AArcSl_1221 [Halalkaliarchaeum desulfuricum]|uniref:Uncharacterized protein n=1 Tax=Halalkaliarchaeum desulfuricum TaxID=2055893 RepID=A0A343TID2_9EURY|nr:hypothetical protein [Halalkaliarchaeum desulfuricum]AUX08854.1 hypothetical protein AArcSl_1221 [Halalkaliarchaeum desulfuricum]
MPCISLEETQTGTNTADHARCIFPDGGEYNCEVVYDVGDDLPDDREWWLLKVTSWMVEWGPPRDVAFTRQPSDRCVRIEFNFDSLDNCREFRTREDHELIVDGDLIVDARIENRCEIPDPT